MSLPHVLRNLNRKVSRLAIHCGGFSQRNEEATSPSVLPALGLVVVRLCRLSGSSATLGYAASFKPPACLAALKKPGDSYEHRHELVPDEDFELV
ncbi:MAG: hypothetical protein ABL994_21015 [Verrucomicrobiales bacterium]